MTKEEMEQYEKAVDFVCLNCAYGEETCDNCPVRKTMGIINNQI